MTVDPKEAAEDYLEQHKIPQLFEALTSQLMFSKPQDPKEFMVASLEKVKQKGTQPLLTEEDLQTMFSMFDVTHRGTITAQQASNALKSIMGQGAKLEGYDAGSHASLTLSQFIETMVVSLKSSVPYKR